MASGIVGSGAGRGVIPGGRWRSVGRGLRTLTVVLVALSGASSILRAEVLLVTGGLAVATIGPRSYEAVVVSGTSSEGDRSTYRATGAVTLTDTAMAVDVSDSGLMIANGGLAAAGYGSVSGGGTFVANSAASFDAGLYAYDGGVLELTSQGSIATPDGQYLYLSGSGAFIRAAGGTYTVGILSTADGVTADFTAGDAIAGDVLVDTASNLNVAAPLATPGTLYLANGGTVTRSTATISTAGVTLTGASSLQAISGDSFANVSVGGGSQFTNIAPLTLATVTVSGDDGSGIGSQFTTGAPITLSVGGVIQISNGGVFNAGHALTGDGATAQLSASSNGSLRVESTLSAFSSIAIDTGALLELVSGNLTADTLTISGSLAFDRTAGTYQAATLNLGDGAAVDYGAADTISTNVTVGSGAVFTLQKSLVLSGDLTLADGGSIVRASETLAVPTLTISGSSLLALLAGDQIDQLTLVDGGRLSAPSTLLLTTLSIDSQGSQLDLASFDGVEDRLRYALRVYGDVQTMLGDDLLEGRITLAPAVQTPGVIYDVARYGNYTYIGYVVAVPEPSTLAFAIGSLLFSVTMLRRRRPTP